MTGQLSPEDRALIERTRNVNKTLSMFVFALQEHDRIPTDSQIGIADMLAALAEVVRQRAARHAAKDSRVVEGECWLPLALEPVRQPDGGP